MYHFFDIKEHNKRKRMISTDLDQKVSEEMGVFCELS